MIEALVMPNVAKFDPIWSARYGKYVHEIPAIPKYAKADTLF
jgi:hypothetical protein